MINSDFNLNAPVLLLIFNRLETTKLVFEQIRIAKPKQLFVSADGPRMNNSNDERTTKEVRDYIINSIDWDCEVHTNFRDENLGCKYAPAQGIDWFFENVEQGIILEDDVLPAQSFFQFCDELLDKYKDNPKVMSISGQNLLSEVNGAESYFFSKNFFGWGWATWKRAWLLCDLELTKYPEIRQRKELHRYYKSFFERMLIKKRFQDCKLEKVKAWDYPWAFTHRINRAYCIVPKYHLVENHGFIPDSTHTPGNKWDKKFYCLPKQELDFPLVHPTKIVAANGRDNSFLMKDLTRVLLKKLF